MSDVKTTAAKRKRSKTTELDPLSKMRVKLWAAWVLKQAGCSPTQIQSRYYFDTPHADFALYAAGQRKPDRPTVSAVARGQRVGRQDEQPFDASLELFEVGPEGAPLWDVLEGGIAACESSVESSFLNEESLRVVGFGQAVAKVFAELLDEEQLIDAREFISEQADPKAFSYRHEVMRWFLVEELEHPMVMNDEESPIDMTRLVACLALARLAEEYRSLERECNYLAAGAAAILKKRLEPIKPELEEFWKNLWLKKVGESLPG